MQPSDYIPNEPERNPLHEFICASVAACVASVYPRADPERFVKIVNRTKAPACIVETEHPPASPRAPETASEYIVRTFSEALDREHARRLRALSYERACESSAAVHCATSDRRDYPADPATLVRSDEERRAADEAHRLARESCPYPDEVVRAAAKGYHETDTDAGPASLG